jgi:hypothetical protein
MFDFAVEASRTLGSGSRTEEDSVPALDVTRRSKRKAEERKAEEEPTKGSGSRTEEASAPALDATRRSQRLKESGQSGSRSRTEEKTSEEVTLQKSLWAPLLWPGYCWNEETLTLEPSDPALDATRRSERL